MQKTRLLLGHTSRRVLARREPKAEREASEGHPILPAPAALPQPQEKPGAHTDLGSPSTALDVLSISKAPKISLQQQEG